MKQATPEAQAITQTIVTQIGNGVLMSLGAHKLGHYTTPEDLDSLVFVARVLPFNAAGQRLSTPRLMRVMVTLTARDDYDIAVDYRRGQQTVRHFHETGIYAAQLPAVMLSVDSDDELIDAHIGHENRVA